MSDGLDGWGAWIWWGRAQTQIRGCNAVLVSSRCDSFRSVDDGGELFGGVVVLGPLDDAVAVVHGRKLELKAQFESILSYFSFKRCNQARATRDSSCSSPPLTSAASATFWMAATEGRAAATGCSCAMKSDTAPRGAGPQCAHARVPVWVRVWVTEEDAASVYE